MPFFFIKDILKKKKKFFFLPKGGGGVGGGGGGVVLGLVHTFSFSAGRELTGRESAQLGTSPVLLTGRRTTKYAVTCSVLACTVICSGS